MEGVKGHRLSSIDMLRGLVMVIMALDHVRDMLSPPPSAVLEFAGADAPLFFTRWITHICAPTFLLLAGTGAFLYGNKGRSRAEVSRFLFTRGAWLVFIEITVVNFGWNFNFFGPNFFPVLQVIWVIGLSMICMAALIWLPRNLIFLVGIAMILGHNLLDGLQPAAAEASALWLILHVQGLLTVNGQPVSFVVYPLIPWVGVMAVGYAMGPQFAHADVSRPRRLILTGGLLLLAFLVLRLFNLYGEPDTWHTAATLPLTLVDFFDTTKYPPSLQFLLMTLGPALVLLGLFERASGWWADALVTIGRVPFFFYVVHLYFIHLLAIGLGLVQGFSVHDIAVVFFAYPPGFGVNLFFIYVAWVTVIIALYPACVWFRRVKARSSRWWLSYL